MHIALKPWELSDAASLMSLCNRVDRSFLSDRIPSPYTEDSAEEWLHMVGHREGVEGVFRAVTVDGKIVGTLSVEQKEDVYRKDAEIGYFLLTEEWSKGIMTEAVRQICEIAFRELDILRITGLVYEPNVASRKVLEKNGFLLEGIMKDAVVKNGSVFNLCIYGKLKNP